MKIFCLLTIIILCNLFSHSQTWAPLGAKWFYNLDQLTVFGYSKFEVVSDSDTLNGIRCSRISNVFHYLLAGNPPMTMTKPDFYTYEDSGKVYASRGGPFYLIQDWNAVAGDVVPFLWENKDFAVGCPDSIGYMFIDNVTTINVNGINYPYQSVHYSDSIVSTQFINTDYIIGHFGAMHYFFFYRSICDTMTSVQVLNYWGLTCYYEPLLGWSYFNGTGAGTNCDYFNSTAELSKNNFTVFPNPSVDKIRIYYPFDFESAELKIFDVTGKNLHVQKISEPEFDIDLGKFSSGYYYISIQTSKGIITQKLLLI